MLTGPPPKRFTLSHGHLFIVAVFHPVVRNQPCCSLAPADTSRVSLHATQGSTVWTGHLDDDVVFSPSTLPVRFRGRSWLD